MSGDVRATLHGVANAIADAIEAATAGPTDVSMTTREPSRAHCATCGLDVRAWTVAKPGGPPVAPFVP